MKKKNIFVAAILTVIAMLGGCSLLGIGDKAEPLTEKIVNGKNNGQQYLLHPQY